ncbi:ATP-binding protein, partial [Butyricicoccus sp. 1XD8-22]
NPKQLMRVCDNLMSNAISHTPIEGEIWIDVSSFGQTTSEEWLFDFIRKSADFYDKESVYLIVQNEGDGIPKDKIDYVFDPLFLVDQARSKSDSQRTGLGLSITKQIIEKHKGDVQLYSKAGVGTCVICRIPKK